MKIHRVFLRNINSLKGEFTLDFNDPGLAGPGIFAITGPTGSGKSTILDAITLALYGTTPRLSSINKSGNELMTRGTGECQAEVTFETHVGGRLLVFRSVWAQRCARNRAGAALQAPTMNLHQESPKEPGDEYESQKLSQVPKIIEDLTGLDFERFCRTCLLAQGQFAAFLEAKNDERAQVLEQITGTGIYTQLSLAAFQRADVEQRNVGALEQQLSGVVLMSDADFVALAGVVAGLAAERDLFERRRQDLDHQKRRAQTLAKLHDDRSRLADLRTALVRERSERAGDLDRLDAGRRAEILRVPLARRDDAQKKRADCVAELAVTRADLPRAQKEQEEAERAALQIRQELAAFLTGAQGERDLLKQVRSLDQELGALRGTDRVAVTKRDGLVVQTSVATAEVQNLDAALQKLRQERQTLDDVRQRTVIDSHLGADLKALEGLVRQRADIVKQDAEVTATIVKLGQDVVTNHAQTKALVAEFERVRAEVAASATVADGVRKRLADEHPQMSLSVLQAAIQSAQTRQAKTSDLRELGREIRDQTAAARERSKQAVQQVKKLVAAAAEVAKLENYYVDAQKALDDLVDTRTRVEKIVAFAEHRQDLRPGEACPLCGAIEHPYVGGEAAAELDGKSLEARIKKARVEAKKTDAALKKAAEVRNAGAAVVAADEAGAKRDRMDMAALQEKWQKLASDLQFGGTADDIDDLGRLVGVAENAFVAARSAFAAFEAATDAVANADKAVNEARVRLLQAEHQQTAAATSAKSSAGHLAQQQQRHDGLKTQREDIDHQLFSVLTTYGIVEFDGTVMPALNARWAAWQRLQGDLDANTRSDNLARETQAATTARRDALNEQLRQVLLELVRGAEQINARASKRRELYGERNPDAEEKRLDAQDAEVRGREKVAVQRQHEAHLALEQRRANEIRLVAAVATCEADLGSLALQLVTALAAAGFADEGTARGALLDAAAKTLLETLEPLPPDNL